MKNKITAKDIFQCDRNKTGLYETGYFADAKKSLTRRSKVHIVTAFGTPICGTKVSGEYLWCSKYVHDEYVECEKCKKFL